MAKEWSELTRLTQGESFVVEKVRLTERDVAIEGEFELPSITKLSAEDLVFVMAFVKVDGSIKQMERLFGISYPTVKNRLRRISDQLELVEIETPLKGDRVLSMLESGEITAEDAIERLSK